MHGLLLCLALGITQPPPLRPDDLDEPDDAVRTVSTNDETEIILDGRRVTWKEFNERQRVILDVEADKGMKRVRRLEAISHGVAKPLRGNHRSVSR